MRREVAAISVHPTGAIVGAAYGLWALLGVFVSVLVAAGTGFADWSLLEALVGLIVGPMLAVFTGYVIGAVTAWLYNRLADRIGGIVLSLGEP